MWCYINNRYLLNKAKIYYIILIDIKEQILNPGSSIGSGAVRQTVFEIHSILIMIFQSALLTIFYFKR